MMRKVLAAALAVALAAAAFANGKAQGAAPAAKPAPGQKLTLWVYDSGRIEVLTAIGKQFEAEYGVKVEVAMVDLAQIRSQMLLASGGDESPDLVIIPHDNLGGLVVNDVVLPIDLGAKKAKYLQPAIDGFTYNGKLYGIPLAVENIGFFRNTKLVPEAPKTWDEMIAVGKKLVESGQCEVIMGFPDATYNVFPIYTSFGGYIFGKKADGSLNPADLGMTSPGFVKGVALMADLVKAKLAPQAIDWDGAHVLFESGKAPFIMTGPWALNRFKTAGVPYAISAFPAAKAGGEAGAPFLGVQGIIVNSKSPRALLAQTFAVDYIATDKNMQAIFDAEARPSAWKSIFEAAADPDAAGFNKAGAKAIPMPSIPEMGYVWDAWVNGCALAFSGEMTPADAMANAKKQIETQIAAKK
jgi:maltose-binding protein MalE